MTLRLEITQEVQRALAREAEVRGVAVPTLALRLLEEAVSRVRGPAIVPAEHSGAEIREWIDSLAEFSDQIPPMQGQTFSREMIYADHD